MCALGKGLKKTIIEISKYAKNKFCMIWVIFDANVMAFLCFISDIQLMDMSEQVGEGGS